ncbi:MAG: bifunctional 5,10-methylenetetrahydrofolate dehydrogenase/5,10-methenyltetrahydrofolate cyclohydrolase [Eubacterium sp.]|nr:bifunctional 5,10-methylenetetrahydrofolate dehydrogenase/5,10-methenyltetrahydrofolate cyclohydrolase [Eubacterium sp.]MBQ9022783.1 bifunctional 5,10-methylenetetrahydrofolate dehydrogenase/5,10-methenyltetrahydrofolate cyclohydrolase [Eubacterium sp.]
MSAILMEGKLVGRDILLKVREDARILTQMGSVPCIATMRIGNDLGSISYEKSINSSMGRSHICVVNRVFDLDITYEQFVEELNKLNEDSTIHAVLIFKPLPAQINLEEIKYILAPEKDPDSMNPVNMGKLLTTDRMGFYPCTAEGVMKMLDYYMIDVKGKDVVIVNNSAVLGKPLSIMLTDRYATVTMCHAYTKDLGSFTRKADIVVSAVGKYGLITPDMLREEAILIDVAMSEMKETDANLVRADSGRKIRAGDARIDCREKVAMITSATPGCGGGTGPITTALLAEHVIRACRMQQKAKKRA